MNFQKSKSGSWLVSTMHQGHYVECIYLYYTKKEARALFSAYLKTL